jgi:hypothetical protein
MRYLFWLWFLPLSLFWGWFGLSYHDLNFGMLFLSRDLHDMVFQIYGSLLGLDPASIPIMFLKACIFDTFLIFGIVAYRKRRQIRQWWQNRKLLSGPETAEPGAVETQVPAE